MVVVMLLQLPLSLRQSPATPPEIPPLLPQRLAIAKPRSCSDINSCIRLFLPFVPSESLSNLAIAVATAFRKNLLALTSTRSARYIYAKRQWEQRSEPSSLWQKLSTESLLFERKQQPICLCGSNYFLSLPAPTHRPLLPYAFLPRASSQLLLLQPDLKAPPPQRLRRSQLEQGTNYNKIHNWVVGSCNLQGLLFVVCCTVVTPHNISSLLRVQARYCNKNTGYRVRDIC